MIRHQAEFPFTLPRGYLDAEGQLHREGSMRLATAKDEVLPLAEYKVKNNPGYLAVILLGRVVSRLGTLDQVNPQVIEDLPVADFAFLQSMYRRVNDHGHNRLRVTCPACEKTFEVETEAPGEF